MISGKVKGGLTVMTNGIRAFPGRWSTSPR
jgi:ribosomal protein S1